MALWPLAMLRDEGPFEARVKSTPVPVSASDCGLLEALSENVTVPVRAPATVGEKTIWTVQTAAGASAVPQLLLPEAMLKSPVVTIPEMVRGTPPLLVRVTVWLGLESETPTPPKARPPMGESETPGGARPVPVSGMVWVRNSSVMVRVPVSAPTLFGEYVTVIAHVA